ncbi:MAG TPA: DUF1343 domain-containing protein, partial [Caldithrix abyssi]|nr:DUF1343 domain-containing protein [Caldithrix abyssi]
FNGEGWLKNKRHADLKIIPMRGWRRSMWYDQTGLPFIKPSPNMPDLETATVYPGLCLLEGTNVSEGRGTQNPFLVFGAPWMDGARLTASLNRLHLPGITFEPEQFTPVSIPGMASHPKWQNKICRGSRILVKDRNIFQPFRSGLFILDAIRRLYPDSLSWRSKHFDRLCGTDRIRKALTAGKPINRIVHDWQRKLEKFKTIRKKYLLYR